MNKIKKIPGGLKFLCMVCIVYLIVFLFNKELFNLATFQTFSMFMKILPLLVFVFLIMVVVNLFIESGKIKKHLGESSGAKGWINATIAGILISGPPYILYPLLKELKSGGMKDSLLAVFLFNRNVKIPFVPVMIVYFGLVYTIVISVYIIVFSIFNGILIGQIMKKNN